MIRVSHYASLDFNPVAYLSFNNDFKITGNFSGSGNMLMLFFKPGQYTISGTLILRRINKTAPIMEYTYSKEGIYNFVEFDDDEHQLLLV